MHGDVFRKLKSVPSLLLTRWRHQGLGFLRLRDFDGSIHPRTTTLPFVGRVLGYLAGGGGLASLLGVLWIPSPLAPVFSS